MVKISSRTVLTRNQTKGLYFFSCIFFLQVFIRWLLSIKSTLLIIPLSDLQKSMLGRFSKKKCNKKNNSLPKF